MAVQTPMIYDVENHLPTFHAYFAQMKRWFVFPRQSLLPSLATKERLLTLAVSGGNFVPAILAIMAIAGRRQSTMRLLAASQIIFSFVYTLCEILYLKRYTHLRRSWLVN